MLTGFALGVIGFGIAVYSGQWWSIAGTAVLLLINGALVRFN